MRFGLSVLQERYLSQCVLEELMKITVAGIGYVGLSLAVLLAQKHEVRAIDIIEEKVDMVNQRRSPIDD